MKTPKELELEHRLLDALFTIGRQAETIARLRSCLSVLYCVKNEEREANDGRGVPRVPQL